MKHSNHRTGISLHNKYEEALDQGTIVIVPILSGSGASRWKCVLVDKEKEKLSATIIDGSVVKWGVSSTAFVFSRGE